MSALGARTAAGGATDGRGTQRPVVEAREVGSKLSSAAPAWSPPAPTVRLHPGSVRLEAPPNARPGSYFSFDPEHAMHPMHGAFAELFRRPQPAVGPAAAPAVVQPSLR